jgi:hypothetical protein
MIVAMQDQATEENIQQVIERMVELGFNVHRTTGAAQTILAGVGTPEHFEVAEFKVLACMTRTGSRRPTSWLDGASARKGRRLRSRMAWWLAATRL